MALLLAATEQNVAEAIKVDNQAHISELSSLIQQNMAETDANSQTVSTSEVNSATQINSQIQNTVKEAIDNQ